MLMLCRCILQDDEAEKNTEIAKMHNIYKYLQITVCSASTYSVNESFLITTDHSCDSDMFRRTGMQPVEISLSKGSLIIKPDLKYEDRRWKYPLNTRAWALQEHVMSRHLLIFSPDGVHMACNLMSAKVGFQSMLDAPLRSFDNSWIRNLGHAGVWRNLISEYTKRRLSFPEDKLIAVSALARQMSSELGSRYVAGLWENALIQQLPWSVLRPAPRPAWRAPTWSWASTDGQISISLGETLEVAQILSWQLTLREKHDPFGAVVGGSLVLLAPHRTEKLVVDERGDGTVRVTTVQDGRGYSTSCKFDVPVEGGTLSGVSVDLAALIRNPTGDMISGLILSPVDRHVYQRIGMFEYAPAEFFSACRSTTFTII